MADLEAAVALIRESIPDVWAIYVFGSRAGGGHRTASDLDLALLGVTRLSTEDRWSLQEALARRLKVDVDLVDLRAASTVMQKEVVATGRTVFCQDDPKRRTFEGQVLAGYARLNEERREVLRRASVEGRVHG
jgi:predicted nucleotidyltransferase